MDQLAGLLDEPVIIQRGNGTYQPCHAESFQFTSGKHMIDLTQEARVVVSHVAAGAIILSLQHQKPLVIVPRRKKYGEHLDDHQFQLARALERSGRAVVVFEPWLPDLYSAVQCAKDNATPSLGTAQLITDLRDLLNNAWDAGDASMKAEL
jgi:UDP-N-acetylglucosamine transferase subunit ALG13